MCENGRCVSLVDEASHAVGVVRQLQLDHPQHRLQDPTVEVQIALVTQPLESRNRQSRSSEDPYIYDNLFRPLVA